MTVTSPRAAPGGDAPAHGISVTLRRAAPGLAGGAGFPTPCDAPAAEG